jgi:hypothetical protein
VTVRHANNRTTLNWLNGLGESIGYDEPHMTKGFWVSAKYVRRHFYNRQVVVVSNASQHGALLAMVTRHRCNNNAGKVWQLAPTNKSLNQQSAHHAHLLPVIQLSSECLVWVMTSNLLNKVAKAGDKNST